MTPQQTSIPVCITHFQTRPLPLQPPPRWVGVNRRSIHHGPNAVGWVAEKLPKLGFVETPLGDFYDVAAQDAAMFRKFEGEHENVRLRFHDRHQTKHSPRISLLLSATGHYVLGIGLGWEPNPADQLTPLSFFDEISAISQ